MINVTYTAGQVFKLKNLGSKISCEFRTVQIEKKTKKEVKVSHWNTNFVGKSFNKAKNLKEGDTITILDGTITNFYNQNNNTYFTNLCIRDFECGNCVQEKKDIAPF